MKKNTEFHVVLCNHVSCFKCAFFAASGTVTLDKTEYTVPRSKATITGLTDGQIDDGAWVGIAEEQDIKILTSGHI